MGQLGAILIHGIEQAFLSKLLPRIENNTNQHLVDQTYFRKVRHKRQSLFHLLNLASCPRMQILCNFQLTWGNRRKRR